MTKHTCTTLHCTQTAKETTSQLPSHGDKLQHLKSQLRLWPEKFGCSFMPNVRVQRNTPWYLADFGTW